MEEYWILAMKGFGFDEVTRKGEKDCVLILCYPIPQFQLCNNWS